MKEKIDESERSFIREHVTPKKHIKKIILTILATIGLALLFGSITGVVFYMSNKIMKDSNDVDTPVQVLIPRDETQETISNGDTSAEVKTSDGISVKSIYRNMQNSMLKIYISQYDKDDIFGREIQSQRLTFGVFIAESESFVYAMFDIGENPENQVAFAMFNNQQVTPKLMGVDKMTGIGILRVSKTELTNNWKTVTLGNSFLVSTADKVYLLGAQGNSFFSVDEGLVTYSSPSEDVVDGYRELFYTNMNRSEQASGVLLNQNSEMIGWVSDYSCEEGGKATAAGINSLKFLLEDLCSGTETGYLGITGRAVSDAEAKRLNVQAGYYIQKIEPDSPVFNSGLEVGDRIISVNGTAISSGQALLSQIDNLAYDGNCEILVARARDSEETLLNFLVKVGRRKDYNPENR